MCVLDVKDHVLRGYYFIVFGPSEVGIKNKDNYVSHGEKHFQPIKKGRFHDLLNVETAFSIGGRTLERRWKLPASSRYSFLGKQKGLISEEIKPFQSIWWR